MEDVQSKFGRNSSCRMRKLNPCRTDSVMLRPRWGFKKVASELCRIQHFHGACEKVNVRTYE
jgi:hypothetical protein